MFYLVPRIVIVPPADNVLGFITWQLRRSLEPTTTSTVTATITPLLLSLLLLPLVWLIQTSHTFFGGGEEYSPDNFQVSTVQNHCTSLLSQCQKIASLQHEITWAIVVPNCFKIYQILAWARSICRLEDSSFQVDSQKSVRSSLFSVKHSIPATWRDVSDRGEQLLHKQLNTGWVRRTCRLEHSFLSLNHIKRQPWPFGQLVCVFFGDLASHIKYQGIKCHQMDTLKIGKTRILIDAIIPTWFCLVLLPYLAHTTRT